MDRAYNLTRLGRLDEAQAALDGQSAYVENGLPEGSALHVAYERRKAILLVAQGHTTAGVEMARTAVRRAAEELPPRTREIGLALKTLAEVLLDAGNPGEAMAAAREAITFFEVIQSPYDASALIGRPHRR